MGLREQLGRALDGRGTTSKIGVVAIIVVFLCLHAAASAQAVTRDQVMQRAQRWVTLAVPYSQTSSFEGYRTDCSGFVSMAWGLTGLDGRPRSLVTNTLPRVSTLITKDDLRLGDAIIRPKTATEWGHAVIFGGWTNAEQTHYWAFEQSGSAGGSRARITPYPYWPSVAARFLPYRFTGIVGDFAERIAGCSRFTTAVRASARTFPDPVAVDTVIVASGLSWADALSGASLAGAYRAPMLLTMPDALPSQVLAEVRRLAPSRAIVLGGERAVSSAVVRALENAGVGEVSRIAGANRFETSVAIARASHAVTQSAAATATAGASGDRVAYVVTGLDFPDALAISPMATFASRPVLLVHPDSVPASVTRFLSDTGVTTVYILGGTGAVSDEVARGIAAMGIRVERIAGQNRYATAIAAVRHGVSAGLSRSGAGLATGTSFADALAGGVAQGLSTPASVLYLTAPGTLNSEVRNELHAHRTDIGMVRMFGGSAALSNAVKLQAESALR